MSGINAPETESRQFMVTLDCGTSHYVVFASTAASIERERNDLRAQLAAVAAERERYRLGMSDWKATADAKDADLINYAAALSGANCTIESLKKERDAAMLAQSLSVEECVKAFEEEFHRNGFGVDTEDVRCISAMRAIIPADQIAKAREVMRDVERLRHILGCVNFYELEGDWYLVSPTYRTGGSKEAAMKLIEYTDAALAASQPAEKEAI